MSKVRCPSCRAGELHTQTIPEHHTRLRGVAVVVPDAAVLACSACNGSSVTAKELKRWQRIQDEQLKLAKLIPDGQTVRIVLSHYRLEPAELATLIGTTVLTITAWLTDDKYISYGPDALLVRLLDQERLGQLKGVFDRLKTDAGFRLLPLRIG